jgi:hypothetical protein
LLIKKNLLEKSVEEYNKFHGAEAKVKVLRQHVNTLGHLLVQFEGPFCFSCAPDEYYVDYQILLEEITGLKFQLRSIKPVENGVTVDFEYDKNEQALVYVLHF